MFEDSTHGGRQRNRAGCVGTHHFNSRPHGGRPSTCRHWLSGLLFQLTPSRRATPLVIFFAHQAIFQLTPSRRVTLKLSKGGRLTIISTHALTEGDGRFFCGFFVKTATNESYSTNNSLPLLADFRSKLSRGGRFPIISTHALTEGDLGQSFHRCCRSCISTHALTEGD